ncbi:cytosolic Fe-S cluster assembly factor NUBP2 homolog isoform X1 [Rhopilema esculentum]|uniref:cytosolic Fe-S cluster assembly factor NUBP2 homolog isoform X1 n=1 Tax=Rhopilema esculentum TaxID=499914 RepID=UPI0031DAE69C
MQFIAGVQQSFLSGARPANSNSLAFAGRFTIPADFSCTQDSRALKDVKHIILVLSGKGGVGKSTVATQLSFGLIKMGKKVGLLDLDLCGPSIPRMMNLKGRNVHQCSEGWLPVYPDDAKQLSVMSIEFLLQSQDDPVIWRGPKKNAMIKQFVKDVNWQQLDYLIIDTPPGTSDEHISIIEVLKEYHVDGAILVTTPQNVSTGDVRREITFCRKTKTNILGIVENMSGFICPHCSECTNIFSSGGGRSLAEHSGVPFLGEIPIDPNLSLCGEKGLQFDLDSSPSGNAVKIILQNLCKNIEST